MAYRARLRQTVQALDATWWFVNDDETMAEVMRLHASGGADGIDTALMCRVYGEAFVACCVAWDGVVDTDTGEPIECTEDARKAIWIADKVHVITAYLRELTDAQGNASAPAEPPTSDTAPES